MSKKKEEGKNEELKIVNEVRKSCRISAKDFVKEEKGILSISPQLDRATGGIKYGSILMVAGPPKYGKTTTLLSLAKNAQKDGFKVIIFDAEGRLSNRDLNSIEGLDLEKIDVFSHTKERILTTEDFLRTLKILIREEEKAFFIVDSLSAMTPDNWVNDDIGKQTRDPTPLLMSKFCSVMAPLLSVSDNILSCVVHITDNTSNYGSAKRIGGGNKINYAQNYLLKLKRREILRDDKGRATGIKAEWISENSPITPPGEIAISTITFGIGVDEVAELVEEARTMGIVKKNLSWYSIGDKKAQGESKFVKMVREDPKLLEKIKKEIDEFWNG